MFIKEWPLEGAMYITYGKTFGGIQKKKNLQIFKILMVSDKTIHRASRNHKSL